ncbi:tRNA glutamyl-Q(34) synthetase GluQRS [Nitratireductor sp. XY-223]|uniref:tRNA glutamyl-Q(34) synthetase GluQRS n=1 Tax=Nitratireductor sp. XY-223 TaxID=2561926 RepID=UPI0010AB3E3F|nr:tRNA glutamyl-Q(34) synthetase GluQRS [Nitratireductor sp. XY-223]
MTQKNRVFRFAPSPNGLLHLGHAYSALRNRERALECGGEMLLRMEDIDTARCTPQFERQIVEDLNWLGIKWQGPVRRQSEHFGDYGEALGKLREMALVYPAFLTRAQIRDRVAEAERHGPAWPRDPDGAPLYPGGERALSGKEAAAGMDSGRPFAWRLDIDKACALAGPDITWAETGHDPSGQTGTIAADPRAWGDVILARKDTPTSYHLSVVVDDALQGITDIVRGHDLFHATSVHRLLQNLLALPEPRYHHHALLVDGDGRKLSKSDGDTAVAALRRSGATAKEVIQMCETGARI